MHPLLQELLEIGRQSPKALVAAVKQRTPELTAPIAEEARSISHAAAAAGNLGVAAAMAGIAGSAYLHLGNRREHLRSRFDLNQITYMQTNTLDEYLELKQDFDKLAEEAEEAGATEVRFLAMCYSGNCLFFAGDTTQDLKLITALMLATLEQVNNVMAMGSVVATMKQLDAFMSLLSGSVAKVRDGFWVDADLDKRDALLRQLALAVEATIPADYEYAGDTAKSVSTARILADLSLEYGSPAAAETRLAAAATMVHG